MKAFDTLTAQKFEDPNQLLNYFKSNKIVCKVDPDTKDRIYALNPDSNRSYTFLVKEAADKKYLYLTKIQRQPVQKSDGPECPGA